MLNLGNPRIAEGLHITKLALPAIQEKTRKSQVRLLVLLIPTKDAAYAPLIGSLQEDYRRLHDAEGRVRTDLISYCQSQHIQCLDLLPRLSQALQTGQRIFPEDMDGHPPTAGHALIAQVIRESLDKPESP